MRGWMKRLLPILLCLMILAPCALAYTTLRPGDKGSDVLKMQQALSALGYSVTCDGTFGTQTYTAVFNFQTDYGLTVDGKAGNETLTKLYELYNSMSAGTPTAAPSAQTPTATVYCANGGSLNVRRGPGTGYGVILQIPNGSTVSVIEKGTKWTQITYDSTTTGYVMTSFLRFNDTVITPTAAPTAIVSGGETAYVSCADGGSLNLRVSPMSGAKILTRVPNGAALTVTRVDGKWCYTTYNGTSGYVMSSFLYFVTTPVVTATPAVTAVPTAVPTSSGNAQSAKVQPANGGSLNLRRQPQSGNNVIAQIPYGTVLSVTPVDTTWCYTTYNGNSGYVMSKFLSFTGSAATATVAPTATPTPSSETLSGYVYCANGKKLNMRSGPGTTYDVVYQIPNGAALTVTQRLSGWYAVTYESYSGYVNSSYIVLNGSAVAATPVPGKVTATPAPSQDNTIHYGELRYATVNTVNSSLNVRKTPGGKQTGSFLKGSRVVVSEILTVDGVQWAAAYQGSVSGYVQLQYLTLDARAQEDSEEDTIKQKYDTSILVRNLKSGATGADVTLVQKRLAELGYLTSANGSYDTATVTAVKRFQKLHGLSQDGIAGQNTFSLLFSASALPYSSEASNYTSYLIDYNESENATRTEAIKRAQNALLKLNYNVATDGKFNEAMHDALVAFQLRNGINATGVLDAATQVKLYSGTAKEASAAPREYLADDAGYTANPPAKSDIKLLYWYTEVKPMMSSGTQYTVYDPESGLSWSLSVLSPGRHCDSQPTTLQDTLIMRKAFGGTSWTMHIVYVLLPDGTWCMAGMHNRPHQSNGILNNGFGGHLCVHFLRDMDECKSADPVTGVQYQNLLRDAWYELTGEKIS
jgi:uncharacterized protein YgiM (DUF1202 family)